jgi:hypothetical protein
MDWLGVLIEPTGFPYCTDWHRDAREILNDEEWEWWGKQKDFGNQVNCALYEDSCTWFVPGSHLRDDTDGERAVIRPDGVRMPLPVVMMCVRHDESATGAPASCPRG